jgi:hypothetical protein
MGIPNLANRRSRSQERQSRCKLAMPNLAIHLGYHRPAGTRQPVGTLPPLPIAGLSLAPASESRGRHGILTTSCLSVLLCRTGLESRVIREQRSCYPFARWCQCEIDRPVGHSDGMSSRPAMKAPGLPDVLLDTGAVI